MLEINKPPGGLIEDLPYMYLLPIVCVLEFSPWVRYVVSQYCGKIPQYYEDRQFDGSYFISP